MRFNFAGDVIEPKEHGHDVDCFTMSEGMSEVKSSPSDVAGSTQVDRAGSVQSDLTCS